MTTTSSVSASTSSSFSSLLSPLEGQVKELLEQVGVFENDQNDDTTNTTAASPQRQQQPQLLSILEQMDVWLGMPSSSSSSSTSSSTMTDTLQVEDCAPFAPRVYELVASLLMQAWDPNAAATDNNNNNNNNNNSSNNSAVLLTTTNVLIHHVHHLRETLEGQDEEALVAAMRLRDCIPAVRVTSWIRQWMEYNVDHPSVAKEETRSFSHYLLLGPGNNSGDNNNNNNNQLPHYTEPLVRALFTHMTWLPTYQSQLLLFNQSFQRGDTRIITGGGTKALSHSKHILSSTPTSSSLETTTTALQDPTQRLHHYQLAQQLAQQLTQEYQTHVQNLEIVVAHWYTIVPAPLRRLARAGLARLWVKFIASNNYGSTQAQASISLRGENTTASGLDVSLRVLHRILLGMPTTTTNDQNSTTNQQHQQQLILQDLLFQQLLPLHAPNAMVLWRDQTSLLELYHEPLVQCMAQILQRYPQWIAPVCQALLSSSSGGGEYSISIWPLGGNTPKQVLLLHQVDTFLGMLLVNDKTKSSTAANNNDNTMLLVLDEPSFVSILSTAAQCMASEHSRLAERALALFRNMYFKQMVYHVHYEASLRVLLPALTRSSSNVTAAAMTTTTTTKHAIPWNPTVRKITFHVLKNLQHHNPQVFAKVCNQVFGTAPLPPPKVVAPAAEPPKKSPLLAVKQEQPTSPSSVPAFNQRFSLQAGMGDWRPPPSAKQQQRRPPPSSSSSSNSIGRHTNMPPPSARPPSHSTTTSQQPPLGVTGIAPWATGPSSSSSFLPPMSSSSSLGTTSSRSINPPLTVTGVAPWATQTPPSTLSSNKNKNPPLTITGVAPWAASGNRTSIGSSSSGTLSQKRPGAPPAIPGMRPKQQQQHKPPTHPAPLASVSASEESSKDDQDTTLSATGTSSTTVPPHPPAITEGDDEEQEEEEKNDDDGHDYEKDNPGLAHVLYYMEQCKPPGMDDNEDEHASSSWSKAQMAETPTLLPDLKFHDLVFGHELGRGAFGVVKYTRLIDRTKTRSQWPEYAVKIIATEKMKEMGYEYSVAREIACLHLISHPNVARLASSFRFQQGAYMVLEYASGGDLHQLLQQHGSLDVPSCQFVMGEVVAALASLHDLGFVYSDLKPENIVITETGHVKLTDFGACRPYTKQAKEMLKTQMGKSGKNLLETLREGDPRKYNKKHNQVDKVAEEKEGDQESSLGWMSTDEGKDSESKLINDDTMQIVDNDQEGGEKEDLQIEGTIAYLPPEVVMGSIPTPAADSWALGCVVYQCLTGRPPILEADDASTRNRIVSFENASTTDGGGMAQPDNDPLFGPEQKHAADIGDTAKALIRSLLDRLPTKRPSMQQIAQHDFFEGQDVMLLYQKPAYPLDVGGVAPSPPDSQWSRRQFSSIWAPQPQAYDISGVGSGAGGGPQRGNVIVPIPEGDEAGSSFSASNFYRITFSRSKNSSSVNTEKQDESQETGSGANSSANTITADLAHQPLAHIEEDDVSMASSEG